MNNPHNKPNLTLLSFTGYAEIEQKIVFYIAAGSRGTQALLNFRSTCTTTKAWVENIPLHRRKCLYAKTVAEINADQIHKYMQTPAPLGVTYFKLTESHNFRGQEATPIQNELWNKFEEFIRGNVSVLDIENNRTFPPPGWLFKTIRNNTISGLKINSMLCEIYGRNDVEESYTSLTRSNSFVELQTKVTDVLDLCFLKELLERMRISQRELNLIVCFDRPREFNRQVREWKDTVQLHDFVKAIGDFSSPGSVQLFDCRMCDIDFILFEARLDQGSIDAFKQCVITIKHFLPGEIDLTLNDFPNLKSVATNKKELVDENGVVLDLPSSLVNLRLTCDLSYKDTFKFFPLGNRLTSLELKFEDSGVNPFRNKLCLLSMHCHKLEHLKVSWIYYESFATQKEDVQVVHDFPAFKALKCFILNAYVPRVEGNEIAESIMFYLGIRSWPLDVLEYSFESYDTSEPEDMVSVETYNTLFDSPILDSLKIFNWMEKAIVKIQEWPYYYEHYPYAPIYDDQVQVPFEVRRRASWNKRRYEEHYGRFQSAPTSVAALATRLCI